MKVPFVDLHAQYISIKQDIDDAIAEVISNTAFISGKYAKDFEKAFSKYTGLDHTIACGNGTDSLEILLKAMGIGPGDEVIIPTLTWISTGEAVTSVGARPVLVDIDEFYCIDVNRIEEKITPKTKAIMPVHLYGHPADMEAITAIADKHELLVLEDSAQSVGAAINGKPIAQFGHAGSFSFYPGKNLGAYGDAGAMVTNDIDLANVSRMIANHGQVGKHNHIMEGRNSRLDGIQGAILSAKLPHIEDWTDARIEHASYYNQILQNHSLVLPQTRTGCRHVFHLYVVQHDDRDGLMEHLNSRGVGVAIHYPHPLHTMPCYEYLGHHVGEFPVAESACKRIVSLPMFPELTREQMDYVAQSIDEFNQ